MRELIDFLIANGYWVLFAWVVVEQVGIPVPATPLLLAAGALAGLHRLSLGVVILLAASAAILSDLLWFRLGNTRGSRVLNWLCRISLEPDSCVRRTEDVFARYGSRALLLSKFVPGLNTIAAPMSAMSGMSLGRFLAFDAAGALLWASAWSLLGYLFHDQIDIAAQYALRLGGVLFWLAIAAVAAYIAGKYLQRRRFLRQIAVARISAEDLKQRLDQGEDVFVIDLRHPLDFLPYPQVIDHALRMVPDELEARHQEIPRDREIVVYCT